MASIFAAGASSVPGHVVVALSGKAAVHYGGANGTPLPGQVFRRPAAPRVISWLMTLAHYTEYRVAGLRAPAGGVAVVAKWRILGDAVVDQDRWWPQLAIGVQWKHNEDFGLVPSALGAKHADGVDVYLAATKLWLDGPFDHNWLVDLTVSASEANQLGLLGFGGLAGGCHLPAEGSVGAFLTDRLLLGMEYRQKANNLTAYREDDFKDAFLSFFPLKYFSVTAAYADLGSIAGKAAQRGPYVSVQGNW